MVRSSMEGSQSNNHAGPSSESCATSKVYNMSFEQEAYRSHGSGNSFELRKDSQSLDQNQKLNDINAKLSAEKRHNDRGVSPVSLTDDLNSNENSSVDISASKFTINLDARANLPMEHKSTSQELFTPPQTPKMSQKNFSSSEIPEQQWIISSSRPENPVDAFSIIISPRANPPPRIMSGACSNHQSTPPLSKAFQFRSSNRRARPKQNFHVSKDIDIIQLSQLKNLSRSNSSTADLAIPNNSVPTSPSSTISSLFILSNTPSTPTVTSTTSLNESNISSSVPAKKSWASLLHSSDFASKNSNTFPISNVIGFSVPASTSDSSSSSPVPLEKKPAIVSLLSSGPTGSGGLPAIRPRGLVNTGNMCFANSVLQVLMYCAPFHHFFSDLGRHLSHSKIGTRVNEDTSLPLVKATVQFLNEFKYKSTKSGDEEPREWLDSFIPTYLYDAMKEKKRFDSMRGGHQEDAEEFLGFFLDSLEEELSVLSESLGTGPPKKGVEDHTDDTSTQHGWVEVGKKNKLVTTRNTKSVESPITRIFNGKFRSILKVPGQRDSVILEDWRALPLDIQRESIDTIEGALRNISHPQAVQVSSVTKGGAIVNATQHIMVDSLPPILVLHLKRFLYDTKALGVVKIDKKIMFGSELEIPSDAITPARRTTHPVKYKLFAVVYHHGSSAAGGHYTLDVLHPNRNENLTVKPREGWIRIDDELVSDLRTDDVFGTNYDDRCAYLLFYKRIGGHLRP